MHLGILLDIQRTEKIGGNHEKDIAICNSCYMVWIFTVDCVDFLRNRHGTLGGKMNKNELDAYVGRIVQIHLKDGTYHVGNLEYQPEREFRWGVLPAQYHVGQVWFTANDVKYVFISIGGNE